jgi:hypothetical protein
MLSFFLSLVIISDSCYPKIKSSPASGNITITLDNFLPNCYTTQNGTTLIPYTLSVEIKYYHGGNRYIPYWSTNYTSSGSNLRHVVLNGIVPKDGTDWEIIVYAIGSSCSLCAAQNDCPQIIIGNGIRAARPQAEAEYGAVGYLSSITINSWFRIQNVANSCGCIVLP